MNKTLILNIIKKNVLSVICGVVVLASLISLLYPLRGMYSKFQDDLDGRKKDYDRAVGLESAKRFLPIVQSGNAQAQRLDLFPNRPVIAEGERARDKVQKQSRDLEAAAEDLNERGHKLLLDSILPVPGDRMFDFAKAYKAVTSIPSATDKGELRPDNIARILGSIMPPDQGEIDAVAKQIKDTEYEIHIVKVGDKEVNRQQIDQDYQARIATLPDEIRQQRAKQYQLYMDRDALSVNYAVTDSSTPARPSDVWFAQLALWIEYDLANSIAAANAAASQTIQGGKLVKLHDANILTNPVKRLVQLNIPMDGSVYVLSDAMLAAAGAGAAAGAPVGSPAQTLGETGFPPDFGKSPTGRTCNYLYDVCRFNLILEVDQRQIPLILDSLQRDKLVTVQSVEISPVDAAATTDAGFVYGNVPMVDITLNCETIYMRNWTTKWMPADVKQLLQVQEVAPPVLPVKK